jgi:hypothetical protein
MTTDPKFLGIDEHYGLITSETIIWTDDPQDIMRAFERGGIAPMLRPSCKLTTTYEGDKQMTQPDLQAKLLAVKKAWRERQPIGTGRAQSFEELEDVSDELRAQFL